MALNQNYAATVVAQSTILQAGDNSRTNPTAVGTIFTPINASAVNAGGQVERITIEPLGNTVATTLRILRNNGTTKDLYTEVNIPATTTTPGTPIVPITLEAVDNPNLFPILIPAGGSLQASINDLQVQSEASIVSIAAAQQTTIAGQFLSLNGSGVVAANVAAIAVAAASTINTPMVLTATQYLLGNSALVSITSGTNVNAVSFKIIGRSPTGALISELLVGPNIATVNSVNIYKSVLAIIPNATNAGTASVGFSAVAGLVPLPLPSPIVLFSAGNLTAINFTIVGMSPAGALVTEVLAGPSTGIVTSINSYAAVFSILPSAIVTTNVSVGAPTILSGFKVHAEGGAY